MSWFENLQPASFRGVPFGVLLSEARFGRRVEVHEYPFRDKPWPEDLGRDTRRFTVTGFLIENSAVYGGGDVLAQREALIGAVESEGPGTLVHPTLGQLTVTLINAGISERWDAGRYFELQLLFIEAGERSFPSAAKATGSETDSAADALADSNVSGFESAVAGPLEEGTPVTDGLSGVLSGFSAQVTAASNDATSLLGAAGNIAGEFGRFAGGHASGFLGDLAGAVDSAATIATLIVSGGNARAAVTAQLGFLASAATAGDAAGMAAYLTASLDALFGAIADPADALRIFTGLAQFSPSGSAGSSPLSLAIQTAENAASGFCRRSALVYVARASARYQPWSADDAAVLRETLTGLFDREIVAAGDDGDDAAYDALRAVSGSVVRDLNARGAALPPLKDVSLNANLPSLVLAQRLYRDPSREAELVFEANPPHPAFMPVEFKALAS